MKKRFLNRIQDRYLRKRFPENLIPKRSLKKSSQYLRGADRTLMFSGRFTNLSSQLKRGTKSIRQTRSAVGCSLLPQIETLEHGSLPPFFTEDNTLVVSSSKVWTQSKMQPNRSLSFDLTPMPTRKKVISLYSCFQLESALSRQQEKRSSTLLLQLLERKKLRILYGNLSNRETNALIIKATKGRGRFGDIVFRLLESRLDVVLCKIGFFPTIPFARQWIYHGKVLVNDKVISFANYLLQPGDVISITQAYRDIVKNFINNRVDAFSICLSRNSKPQSQPEDKTDYHLSVTKTNLRLFPWFRDHTLLERMTPDLPIIDVEAQNESGRWNCNISSTKQSQKASWKITTNHQGRKQGKPLIDLRLTLLELLGNPTTTHTHRSNKGKFCLATWQCRQEILRNKLRLVSPKLSHVEVSYKLLKAVYLYPTQKVAFPAIIDIERILNL